MRKEILLGGNWLFYKNCTNIEDIKDISLEEITIPHTWNNIDGQDNGVLFNPIVAGDERNSWLNVREVSAGKFRNGTFKGEYQENILKDFFAALAEEPDWKIH